MNAALLLIPLILIRFLVPAFLGRGTSGRASVFAPMEKSRRVFYWSYQMAQLLLLLLPFFSRVSLLQSLQIIGLVIWILGGIVQCLAMIHFSRPAESGLSTRGIYRLSRHPMYLGYLLYYTGIGLMMGTLGILYPAVLLIFALSQHQIILAEERWCLKRFGKDYEIYMDRVRRYFS